VCPEEVSDVPRKVGRKLGGRHGWRHLLRTGKAVCLENHLLSAPRTKPPTPLRPFKRQLRPPERSSPPSRLDRSSKQAGAAAMLRVKTRKIRLRRQRRVGAQERQRGWERAQREPDRPLSRLELLRSVESHVVPWPPFRGFPWRFEAEREQSRIRPVAAESGTVFDLGAEFWRWLSQFFWPRSWQSSVASRRGRF
jgi:hypothetical protein